MRRGELLQDDEASIGVGSLIIFIAMIMVAGVTASVLLQTMNSLQQQALETGAETINEISSGVRVTQVSGYSDGSNVTEVAIFVSTIAGSKSIDLSNTFVSISDTSSRVILNYESNCFNNGVSNGLFQTLNSSKLSNKTFGVIVIRDADGSCLSATPVINDNDLVALMVNTTSCFSGIDVRTEVSGNVVPEQGMRGVIAFTTPSAFTDTILNLQ
ncbi:MAG: archaellin/type IV pilin N-terminal domain-containing protein [Candidatus Thermoplasmatota archaeon]